MGSSSGGLSVQGEAPVRAGDVAPFITDAVGDVDRPAAALDDRDLDFSHLPGSTSWMRGMGLMWRSLRHGIAFNREFSDANPPVNVIRFGSDRIVWVSDYDAIEAIGSNADGIWSTAISWRGMLDGFEDAEELCMLLTMDGDAHRGLRRALQPAFSGQSLRGYREIAEPMYDEAVERWAADGRVRFKSVGRRLFARSALAIFLGVTDPDDAALFDRDMTAVWQGILLATSRNPAFSFTWRKGLRGWSRIRARLLAMIAERRDDPSTRGDDLLSALVASRTELPGVEDDVAIVQVIMNVMIAAFDTTSMASTSMAYGLATHPEWQTELREELRNAAADAVPHDARAYPKLDWTWRETLRRWPVTGVLARRPTRDVDVAGHTVPAGALVWAAMGLAATDPELWTEPTRFDPERFSPERAEYKRRPRLFAPFGMGAHACIGMQLAALEAKTLFALLLRDHTISLRKPYEARHTWSPLGTVSGAVELVLEPV